MSLRKICESIRASSRDFNIYETYGTYLLEAISRYAARKVAEDPKVKRTLARGLVPSKKVTQDARNAAAQAIRAERKTDPDKVRSEYKAAKTKAGGSGSLFDAALDKPGRRPQTGGTRITYTTKDGKVQRVKRDPTSGRPIFSDEPKSSQTKKSPNAK